MSWKKKTALGFLALFALIFLFLVEEHFRGAWALSRWKARMAAKGVPLTIAEASPPTLPSGENGMPALIAAISNLVLRPYLLPEPTYVGTNKLISILKQNGWRARSKRHVTWKELTKELAVCEGALTSGIEALNQPQFQALDYRLGWQLPLRHLGYLWRFVDILCASALHELHEGRMDEGVNRLEAAIRCLAILRNEPVWVSQMVRANNAVTVFECTWQALHANGLQPAHLRRLQSAWSEQDFVSALPSALYMECAIVTTEFDRFRKTQKSVDDWLDGQSAPSAPVFASSGIDVLLNMIDDTPSVARKTLHETVYTPLWKLSWSRQDQLHCLELIEERIDACRAAARERSAARVKPFGDFYNEAINSTWSSYGARNPYDFLRYCVSPRTEKFYSSMSRFWAVQTRRELAVAALALKRYELRHGEPAPSLKALVPEFLPELPRDFMNGQVLKYDLAPSGRLLYSTPEICWPQEVVDRNE